MNLRAQPLLRLLAINLAVGAIVAALMLGGLIALDPGGLRHLLLADASPGLALGLLTFGFVVTFASVAMGSAIMALGRRDGQGGGRRLGFLRAAPALRIGSAGTRDASGARGQDNGFAK
jgi:hypothetical protein